MELVQLKYQFVHLRIKNLDLMYKRGLYPQTQKSLLVILYQKESSGLQCNSPVMFTWIKMLLSSEPVCGWWYWNMIVILKYCRFSKFCLSGVYPESTEKAVKQNQGLKRNDLAGASYTCLSSTKVLQRGVFTRKEGWTPKGFTVQWSEA